MMHFLFLIIISLVILFSEAFFIDSHITLHNRFSALRSITGTSSEKGAENLNRRRNSHNFNDLINQGSKTGVYTAAVRAATLYLHDSNNKLTPSGLTSVIKIYGLSGNVDDAIDALSVAKNRHLNVNIKHINAVINVCKKHKRYEDALKIFEKATDEMSLQPDVASISSIISVLGNLNKWEQALTHFESVKLEERDQILFSSILSALDASGRGNECLAILASATDSSSNIKRTVHMYTSTISALGKIGDMYHVWKVYQQALQELGQVAKCDRILTYTVLKILDGAKMFEKAALVRQNSNCADTPMQTSAAAAATSLSTSTDKADVQFSSSAARGFEDSLSEDSSPSPPLPSFSFSDLIREARRSGDFRAAVAAADSWLGDSSRSSLSAGGVTSCITIYGMAKKADKALAVLDILQKRNVIPNVVQYNAVMSACVRGGKPEQALVLYERMQDQGERDTDSSMGRGSGLVRDDYSYGVAMSAMAQTGRWADAHKLLNNLPSKLQKSTILCNTVLGALSAAGQFDLVRELFESMRTEGPAPDKVTFYTVVAALEKAGDLKEAANLRSEMGLRPVASAVVASASELSPSVSAAQRDRRTSKSPVDEAAIEKRNRNTTPDVAGPHWATDGDELDEDGSDGKSDKKLLTLSHEELEAFLRSYSPAGTLEEKLLAQGRIRESPLTADGAIGSNYDTSANTGTGSVSRWEGGGAGVASLMKLLGMSGKTAQVIELLRRVEEEDRRDSGNSNYECTVPIAVYNAAISACAQSDDWRRALEAYAAMTIEDNTDSLLDLKAAVTLKVPRNRRTYESLLPALEKAAAGGGDGDGDPEAANFLLAVKERARLEGLC